jgi:hypothetical protein
MTSRQIQIEIEQLESGLDDRDPGRVGEFLLKQQCYALWEIALQLAFRNEAIPLLVGHDLPHEATKPTEAKTK